MSTPLRKNETHTRELVLFRAKCFVGSDIAALPIHWRIKMPWSPRKPIKKILVNLPSLLWKYEGIVR